MRIGAVIILMLILINALAWLPVSAQSSFETSFYAPAVSDTGKADLIKVDIRIVIPGSGVFEVNAGGDVDNTTYHSMKMAVMAASMYAGIRWNSIDVYITLETNRNVAGPSGSLGVAIMTYLLLTRYTRGYTGPGDVAITGAISPDGSASRVGAVGLKCKAAMEQGVRFLYPLVNYTPQLGIECNGMPVPSMINGTMTLLNAPTTVVQTNISLPIEFHKAMREAAASLASKAEVLLAELSGEGKSIVESRLNASASVLDRSPYAAASLAFTALYNAYRFYYQSSMLNGTNVYESASRLVSSIEEELREVETRLEDADYNGSILYIEFLSTAYTRLADAKSSLEEASGLIRTRAPIIENILANIALAKARIDTINTWIDTADRVREAGPSISIDEARLAVSLYGDYAEEAVLYANSILKYFIENYNVPRDIFQVRINTINNLLRDAKTYYNEGNYIAALGFYREALSRTLSQIFGFFLTRSDPSIINGYYRDLGNLVSMIQAQLASHGLVSGLALAYREYSEVLLNDDPATAIGLLEEALSSLFAWYTLLLSEPMAGEGIVMPESSPALRDPVLTVTVGIAAYILALTLVGWYVVSMLKRTIYL